MFKVGTEPTAPSAAFVIKQETHLVVHSATSAAASAATTAVAADLVSDRCDHSHDSAARGR